MCEAARQREKCEPFVRGTQKHARHKYSFPVHKLLFFLLRSVLAAVSSRCIFFSISFNRIHPSANVSDSHQILFNAASEKPCNLNVFRDLRDLRVVVDLVPS